MLFEPILNTWVTILVVLFLWARFEKGFSSLAKYVFVILKHTLRKPDWMRQRYIIILLSKIIPQKSSASWWGYWLKQYVSKIPVPNFDSLKHELPLKIKHMIREEFLLSHAFELLEVKMPVKAVELKRYVQREVNPVQIEQVTLLKGSQVSVAQIWPSLISLIKRVFKKPNQIGSHDVLFNYGSLKKLKRLPLPKILHEVRKLLGNTLIPLLDPLSDLLLHLVFRLKFLDKFRHPNLLAFFQLFGDFSKIPIKFCQFLEDVF